MRKKGKQSPYLRTTLALVGVIVCSFMLLIATFYRVITSSVNQVRSEQLAQAATEFSDRLQASLLPQNYSEYRMSVHEIKAIQENMSFMSHLTKAYVWLVLPNGQIVYNSEMPEDMREMLWIHRKMDDTYWLDKAYIGEGVGDEGLLIKGGSYHGLFSSLGGDWISVVRPVFLKGERVFYLQMHQPVRLAEDIRLYLLNGLAVSMLIAVIVAMAFVWVFTKQISRPLSLLASAAKKVSLGDFSVRVSLPPQSLMNVLDENDQLREFVKMFNHMIARIEDQNVEQRNFISSISHDLRTPLTSISGFTQAMLDGTISDEQRERYLGMVASEAKSLAKLVKEMNDVVQIDGTDVTYTFTEFDLAELMRHVLEAMEPIFSEKEIQSFAEFEIDSKKAHAQNGQIMVYADEVQIRRVLTNLLGNASKFTPEKGLIEIKARLVPEKKYVLVTVEDNGPGVAEEDRPYIFDRFYKVDRSRTGKQGSGFGLYICRRILHAHGQQIWVDRSKEGGALFGFTLPLA